MLSSVETNLTSFQNDLAVVSAEIETLQARSTALNVRLENRKVIENGLGPIVEEISISPAVVRKIVDGAIDEAWVRALAEVEKRSKAMDAKSNELRNIKGISDLKPLLENLVNKVSPYRPINKQLLSILSRRLRRYETFLWLKSRLYDRQISMLKLYSSNISFDTKTFSPFYIGITPSWPTKSLKPT